MNCFVKIAKLQMYAVFKRCHISVRVVMYKTADVRMQREANPDAFRNPDAWRQSGKLELHCTA